MNKFFLALLLFGFHADLSGCRLSFIVGIFTISRCGLSGFTFTNLITNSGTTFCLSSGICEVDSGRLPTMMLSFHLSFSSLRATLIMVSIPAVFDGCFDTDSDSIFRRTLLGYYAEGMHANFKENLI